MVSGSEGHMTSYSKYAITLDSTYFHCPSSVCRESIFLVGQYYCFKTDFLHIYRGRLSLHIGRQLRNPFLSNEVLGVFIEVPKMYETGNVSVFEHTRTAKRLDAKLQPRVNFYDLSCKPMKLRV